MPSEIESICGRGRTIGALCILWAWTAGCTGQALDGGAGGARAAATGGTTGAGDTGGGSPGTGAGGSTHDVVGGAGGAPSSGGASGAAGGRSGTGGMTADAGAGRDAGGGGPVVDAGSSEAGGPSGCIPGRYIICEDFESTAVGAVPAGWTKHGNAAVAADQAARGHHSLRIEAAANGERRIYTDATKLGAAHWGRVFYRVQLPVPTVFVHSTIVAFQGIGPVNGNEEVRVVDTVKAADGTHQFLYNVQPSGSEFGKGSAYNWRFDGSWHCAEWHIDSTTQSYHFFYDGTEVTQIAIDNGAGKFAGSDIPPVFSQAHVGWNNYQSAPPGFVAWIDEVAMDTNRIGCAN